MAGPLSPDQLLKLQRNKDLLKQLPQEASIVFKYFLLCTEYPRVSQSLGGDQSSFMKRLEELAALSQATADRDKAGNLVLRMKGSAGHENDVPLTIQCHMDMVCSADAQHQDFDFFHQPIVAKLDGEWLKADGTTLGADDGIGIAACMSLIENPPIPHPPLELLMTENEETSMGGAEGIAGPPFISGRQLLNIDSETVDSICVGCAGGFEGAITLPVQRQPLDSNGGKYALFDVTVQGLQGGHSGIDINKGRANAIILLARLLSPLVENAVKLQLVTFLCSSAFNTIPRQATARVAISSSADVVDLFKKTLNAGFSLLKDEFQKCVPPIEPTMQLLVQPVQASDAVPIDIASTRKTIDAAMVMLHGVLRMDPSFPDQVQSSIAFSRINLKPDSLVIEYLARSSSEEQMDLTFERLKSFARSIGATYSPKQGAFPAWQPNATSAALAVVKQVLKNVSGKDPVIYSVHAGLEVGFFEQRYPGIDSVSIGPTIENAHTPDERLQLDSVPKFYQQLRRIAVAFAK